MKTPRTLLALALCVLLGACSSSESTGGTGGAGGPAAGGSGGSGGTSPQGEGGATGTAGATGRGGTGGSVVGTGGVGTGGDSGGRGGSTGGAAGSGSGGSTGAGGVAGTGGGGSGGSAGAGGAENGGSGGGGAAGASGSGGQAGASAPPKVTVQLATSIPSQYGSAVANPGKVTKKTYPVYYYTTQSGGSNSLTGSIPRQSQPIMKPCNVYTPPNYDPQTEYPLIFVLHGITDNQDTWFQRGSPVPNVLLDNLITSKTIKPVIAVFPDGDSKPNYATDTSYTDTAGYYVFGNELMNDLVPFIEANYSVKKDRGSRAISGFSMGGMQTVNIGLCQNLKNFAWFGAFSPAPSTFTSDQIASYLKTENEAESDPVYFFYAVVGSSDTTAGSSTDAATSGLTSKTPYLTSANFATHKIPGGQHIYPTASIGLYNFLRIAFSN